MCTLLATHIQHQNQQALQQQEMMRQMLSALSINTVATHTQKQNKVHPIATQEQDHNITNHTQVSESFSTFSSNASKFLSSQIPQFGGTEEENVEIWIEKIESVATIHGFPQGVMLSATFSRLTKSARRWFDHSTESINSSWTVFKTAIISRFKRKIFYGATLQKVEAQKWLFYKESFTDYALDKITLPLELSDADAIHFLINGITTLAIRWIASSLKVESLDEFLREMEEIATSCNNHSKRLSTTLSRKDKVIDPKTSSKDYDSQKKKDLFCVYCRGKNHIKEDCFKLKKKRNPDSSQPIKQPTATTVAAVENTVPDVSNTIAYVKPPNDKKFVINSAPVWGC